MKKIILFLGILGSLFFGLFPTQSFQPIQSIQAKSQIILLLGVDTGEGRTDQGRSDVIMLLDLNSQTQQGVLASIPRDSYVNIPGYGMDKINHAYAFGGAPLAMETVSQWLGVPVSAYMTVNMSGLKEIVEVVGTITVVPPTTFSIGGYNFYQGQPIDLTPDMALQYARERYTSGGDYGRQGRQRDVVQALIREAAQLDNLLKFSQLFTSLTNNIDTNLSLIDLFQVFRDYQALEAEANAKPDTNSNLVNYQLTGYGVTYDGIYYEEIDPDSLAQLQAYLLAND